MRWIVLLGILALAARANEPPETVKIPSLTNSGAEATSAPPSDLPDYTDATEARMPVRLQRERTQVEDRRLDVRQGAFNRQEVRPYNQTPQDRYGRDF